MEEQTPKNKLPRQVLIGASIALLMLLAGLGHRVFFGAPTDTAEEERFIIARNFTKTDVISRLTEEEFIKYPFAFRMVSALKDGKIQPGGYHLSKQMSVWEVARVLSEEPYMHWITLKEGLRKEEIAEIFGETLGWNSDVQKQWIEIDTARDPDRVEGVYFPDTYLISKEEAPQDVAKRLIARFEEKFAPFAEEALKQNIRWPTLLKVASLVQREAAGEADMPIIAGVIWNRLTIGMKLDVDATVQYARGDTGKGWWAPPTSEDKELDSPFNTYKHKGLPPHPIANPGEAAIRAALFPANTRCVYYLHDRTGKIHCSETFEEHKAKIEQYLR